MLMLPQSLEGQQKHSLQYVGKICSTYTEGIVGMCKGLLYSCCHSPWNAWTLGMSKHIMNEVQHTAQARSGGWLYKETTHILYNMAEKIPSFIGSPAKSVFAFLQQALFHQMTFDLCKFKYRESLVFGQFKALGELHTCASATPSNCIQPRITQFPGPGSPLSYFPQLKGHCDNKGGKLGDEANRIYTSI